MSAKSSVALSAAASFVFYTAWSWWVNSMVSEDQILVLRSGLLQGSYSAMMAATFTSFLNWILSKMKCQKRP